MKNRFIVFSVTILILITNLLYSQEKFKIKVLPIEIKKSTANSYSAKFSVKYKGLYKVYFDDTTVPIPVEEMIIEGEFTNYEIKERDFLFAGVDIDINGDKDLDDFYKIKFNYNKYYINKYKLKGSFAVKKNSNYNFYKYFNNKNESLINSYGENGKSFLIYRIDYNSKKMIVGLNKGEKPLEIKQFPNPNIQIILMKPVESINKKVNFSIGTGPNFYAFSNEKIIPGNDDLWNGIAWIVKKIKINKDKRQEFKISLNNISPPFAIYVVPNLAMVKGIRIRMNPGVRLVIK